ncbi:putative tRNA-splicing endonuclease subunit tsp-1 [Escovopsis weberi]|uniref:Putative tRNA-splicing endonuclease subunit tsp-1 n=1 Tax=Escovopsis weberi TaxID=150374 RepID=A0A0M9VTX7_ESCWE|nr:putative tRNA-splicing endonuclease subunit tsp-1 [Escovopsis weberi]
MDNSSSPGLAVENVTSTVFKNLEDQHDWTSLRTCAITGLERPLIQGFPPRLLYLHPDDQIEALALEKATGEKAKHDPELEWVLPVHLSETWSLAKLSAVFDAIPGRRRAKRIVLATLHNDSTVVYYLLHEGMVKPRQN